MLHIRCDTPSRGFTKVAFTVSVILVCSYIAARFFHLSAYGLWFDEVFSVQAARLDWRAMLSFVGRDIVHPPLFYLLLKLWLSLGGESVLWLRLFPCLTAVIALVPFFFLCRELYLTATEINTTLLFCAANSYLIYYAQEVRMYSLLLCLTLFSLWAFVRFVNRQGAQITNILILSGINLLLIYTQYFGWLVVGAECVYVIFWARHQSLAFALQVAALVICFAPWAYVVIRAATLKGGGLDGNLAWLQPPNFSDLIWYFATLHGVFEIPRTTLLGLLIFGFPLACWTARIVRRQNEARRRVFRALVLFAFLPVIFAFVCSRIIPHSIWGERYLIIAAVPYLILAAVAIYQLPWRGLRIAFACLALGWAAASGGYAVSRQDKKLDWDTLAHTMTQVAAADATSIKVYAAEDWVAVPIRYALELAGESKFEVTVVKDLPDARATHFWVAVRETPWRRETLSSSLGKANNCRIAQEIYTRDRSQTIKLFSIACQPQN